MSHILHLCKIISRASVERVPNDSEGELALEEMCQLTHRANVLAGWWSDIDTGEPKARNVGEMLMLAVSELAEIPPAPYHLSVRDDKLPKRLMAEVEIADFCIRLFDLLGKVKPPIQPCWQTALLKACFSANGLPPRSSYIETDMILPCVRFVALAMEGHRKGKTSVVQSVHDECEVVADYGLYLIHAVQHAFAYSRLIDYALPAAIAEKMEYNANREDHKLETRRKEGGKAY